jgi:Polyphosphate kinase 2 (PPK2)
LKAQRLPPEVVMPRIWNERFADINAFERYLLRNGIMVVKFHLRISKSEQKRRLLERLSDPSKLWKTSMEDVAERRLWRQYMSPYEDAIRNASTPHAPWYVVPSDHKWFARMLIAAVIVEVLDRLHLDYPKLDRAELRQIERIRKALDADWAARPARRQTMSTVDPTVLRASMSRCACAASLSG